MRLNIKGISANIKSSILGSVTRDRVNKDSEKILIFDSFSEDCPQMDFAAYLSTDSNHNFPEIPIIHSLPTLEHLQEGDIVAIHSDGHINTLYRVNSNHNFILLTERCNSNCLMCSQPPKNKNDNFLLHLYQKMIPLIPKECPELGITGGEPTLLGSEFVDLLLLIKTELPETEVHCLTNGRAFAWNNFADKIASLKYEKLMFGIPLYSDDYTMHDYIVQARGAYEQTLLGIYNLAAHKQRIEIRIVLHKLTVPRLAKLSRFIYKNLPFVEHVAFMGLEYQGYTPHNIDKLWIDPTEYMNELSDAAEFLFNRDLNVSIYNLQLCLMPKHLWKFTRKSISDWKNIYLDTCDNCNAKDMCGGLFASSTKFHSPNISAITTNLFET